MSEAKRAIEAFLAQMREQHQGEIDAIELPEGTEDYLQEKMAAGDSDTLSFMLKLSYLMGLHTGLAAQHKEGALRFGAPTGPLEA